MIAKRPLQTRGCVFIISDNNPLPPLPKPIPPSSLHIFNDKQIQTLAWTEKFRIILPQQQHNNNIQQQHSTKSLETSTAHTPTHTRVGCSNQHKESHQEDPPERITGHCCGDVTPPPGTNALAFGFIWNGAAFGFSEDINDDVFVPSSEFTMRCCCLILSSSRCCICCICCMCCICCCCCCCCCRGGGPREELARYGSGFTFPVWLHCCGGGRCW